MPMHTPMRPYPKHIAALLAAALSLSAATAAPSAPDITPALATSPSLDDNAALHYWRAWQSLGGELGTKASEEYNSTEKSWVPSPELTKLLDDQHEMIGAILRASKIRDCDWGIAYEEGVMALAPHLGHLRKSTRILGADARLHTSRGKGDDAAERVAGMLRLASHTRTDRLLISGLVSCAIVQTVQNETRVLAASAGLTDVGRKNVAAAARLLQTEDPFSLKAAIAMERDVMLNSILKVGTGPDAGAKVAKIIEPFQEQPPVAVQTLSEPGVRKAVEQLRTYYDAAIVMWDQPDAQNRLKELDNRAAHGEFGPLGSIMGASVGRCYKNVQQGTESLRTIIELMGQPAQAK